ncbi:tRNA (cytosine-5-)-methyltransferase [Pseudohyphozyma bogoriensis]|nr:tRNA (cytosine-5-)-methyltransferase [Pseudohyphozyma bogoriensis]
MGRRGRGKRTEAAPRKAPRWTDVPDSNDKFEAYYKRQQIVPEEEWQAFMDKLHDPLPTTFRITSCREIAQPLNEMINRVFVPFLTGLEHEGTALEPPKQLSWYPGHLAWQLNVPKNVVRKNDQFKKFQHFLVSETEAGNISRQEAVSMIPPLVLECKPEHFVLDMCAAPGSKSAQLLEAIHALPPPSSTSSTTLTPHLPPGLLIANDSDAKRCHLLVHQSLHRIPAAEMMVTNHDATQLPGLRLPAKDGEGGKKWEPVLFDRILADVPCSGDGTLRKNMGIWREWTVGNGVGLHSLQLRILMRGIALLKPGGRLVYSTCSMNPIENEAVVSAALEAAPEMHLIDSSDLLPTLLRRPGLYNWEVLDSNLEVPEKESVKDTMANEHKKGQKKTWVRSLWPNGKEKERHLERCWRLYPHLMDTGGFFVAVLEKKADGSVAVAAGKEEELDTLEESAAPVAEAEKSTETTDALKRTASDRASPVPDEPSAKRTKADDETPVAETAAEALEEAAEAVDLTSLPADVVGGAVKGVNKGEFKEEPFIYLPETDEEVKLCIDFFGLSPSFPMSSLLVRNAQGKPLRSIYFTSPLVHTILDSNSYTRMRLISCGTKLFSRQGQDGVSKDGSVYRCKWRLMSEGLEVIRPFMGEKRVVRCGMETFELLMRKMNLQLSEVKEEAFLRKIEGMEMGSCVLEVAAVGKDIGTEQNLILPFWKSQVSVNLMVEKVEKSALSNRLWGKDITPHAPGPSKRDVRRAEEAAKAAGAASGVETGTETEGGALTEGEVVTEAEAEEGEKIVVEE